MGAVVQPISRDRHDVPFAAAEFGTERLTWGQKAIFQDMQDSGNQFSMGGRLRLPEGSTIGDAAARLSGLMRRHAALRMRLRTDSAGHLRQEIARSGRMDLDIHTISDDADRADVLRYAADLMDNWPLERFDFHRDWPLRMAVIRHRGACLHLVWALSHLAADGGANVLLLHDLHADDIGGRAPRDVRRPQILDVARSEGTPRLRQLSSRAMRHWESALRHIPAQTFGEPARPPGQVGQRYWQARFTSPA